MFVPPANNIETENNDVKNELASENIDKGKSILRAPLKLDKKEIKNLRAQKGNSSLSRKSSIFVITVMQLDILDLIATSGQPLKRATA